MKTAILALVLLIGGAAFGQEKLTPEQRADRLTEKMTKNLALTADQTEKISQVNRGIAGKNAGIRSNTTFTKEQKDEIISSNREAAKSMYQGILTTEQYNKFLEAEKAMMAKKDAKKAERKAGTPANIEESDDL